jgi:hypothetical protein
VLGKKEHTKTNEPEVVCENCGCLEKYHGKSPCEKFTPAKKRDTFRCVKPNMERIANCPFIEPNYPTEEEKPAPPKKHQIRTIELVKYFNPKDCVYPFDFSGVGYCWGYATRVDKGEKPHCDGCEFHKTGARTGEILKAAVMQLAGLEYKGENK